MSNTSATNDSIALLIDADNAPAAKIDFIIAELATYGVVNIRRAYGNWKKPELSGWEKVLHEYAIQPIQHFDLIKGKNAADMALLIEAMDILYTKRVGTFCLVSSDCDFTPLALRLRADGKQVVGFGSHSAPEPFVNSCTRFLYLDETTDKKAENITSTSQKPAKLKVDAKLMTTLKSAVEATEADDGWALLGEIGHHINNQGSFDSRNYGFKKLSDLFAATNTFELKKTPSGSGTLYWVRIRK